MEELGKDLSPGLMLESTGNTMAENNHVGGESEPAFSDEEEDMPLRYVFGN